MPNFADVFRFSSFNFQKKCLPSKVTPKNTTIPVDCSGWKFYQQSPDVFGEQTTPSGSYQKKVAIFQNAKKYVFF